MGSFRRRPGVIASLSVLAPLQLWHCNKGYRPAQVAKAAKSSSCEDQQIFCLGQEDVSTEVTCNFVLAELSRVFIHCNDIQQ